ncbi:MAG: phosphatidylserine decarboxylase [Nitrospiraceae bacterium]
MIASMEHQYIDRETAEVRTERLFADPLLRWMYASPWEDETWLLRTLTSARASQVLGFLNYGLPIGATRVGVNRFIRSLGADLTECVDPVKTLDSPRKIFERQLRYWDVRPMDCDPEAIVSPCDARVLVGSFAESSALFLKGKFFEFEELFGKGHHNWPAAFDAGDFAIFRLTPDKYHYNHTPVAGTVRAFYEVAGRYHSCNPGSVVSIVTPYSKNARVVTILDTDVPNGSGIGLVAMIEIVALMIGRIEQCYSPVRYQCPRPIVHGMFISKGQPKSLYHPGSSTTVLVFQQGRVEFCEDLIHNLSRSGVRSRFSQGFGKPLIETDIKVRSTMARAIPRGREERRLENVAHGQ